MNYYLDVIRKYAVFDGRASRKQFWMFFLINFGIALSLHTVFVVLKQATHIDLLFLSMLYGFAMLCPNIAVTIRRLHDSNRSAITLLYLLVPFLGPFIVLAALIKDGTPSDNQFGPNPKAISMTTV